CDSGNRKKYPGKDSCCRTSVHHIYNNLVVGRSECKSRFSQGPWHKRKHVFRCSEYNRYHDNCQRSSSGPAVEMPDWLDHYGINKSAHYYGRYTHHNIREYAYGPRCLGPPCVFGKESASQN